MQNNKNAHRKRGVRASRAKLTSALTRAGLRTQAALAERIADLEGLEAAPRDAVSRLFRELPVEATTLARAARALGVEPHTLYLTSDEERPEEAAAPAPRAAPAGETPAAAVNGMPAEAPGRPPRYRRLALGSLALLLVVAAAGWFLWPRDGTAPRPGTQAPILDLGEPMLVVMPIDGEAGEALGDALREALGRDFRVATKTASVLTRELDAKRVANRLRTDVIVEGEIVTVGRLAGLRFFGFVNGVREQVWAESVPAVALPEALGGVAANVSRAVKRVAGMAGAEPAPHFPPAAAQDDYLWGEYYLDRPSNELNVKRAQSRFEAALRQDPDYAHAFAGLCRALLEEHWMSDEERALNGAARACGHALQLAPGDPVVNAAHAHFLRLTGRNDEAIALYEKVVGEAPRDAAALGGLAYSLMAAYQQGGDHEVLVRAKETARRAADTDPAAWKPLFWLGAMEWFDGNVEGAIAASEEARARDENEYVLANLGTFYLCGGAIPEARDAYVRAQELAPQSYVGDEFLGTAYYFLGDFQESARLRQRAIDSIAEGDPEIHQMWGNLADSWYQLGRTRDAIAAYLKAAEIAERDQLRGNAPVADRAARAYYYTVLGKLDPKLVPETVARSLEDELDGIAAAITDATAHRRMAQTYLLRGEHDKARAALARSTAICPGYGQLPDLAALHTPPSG
jgi:tetratricopeptide (TPR) repeat protein